MSETLRIVLSKLKDTEARTCTHILYHFVLTSDTSISKPQLSLFTID